MEHHPFINQNLKALNGGLVLNGQQIQQNMLICAIEMKL